MQLGFPFLFHVSTFPLWFQCCNSVKIAGRKACTCHTQRRPLPLGITPLKLRLEGRFVGVKGLQESSFPNLFRPPQRGGVVQLLQRTLNMLQSRISIIFQMTSSIQDFVSLSDPGTGTFRPRDWQGSAPHLYVTEELSKCSFRLSAGGGPRHLAPVVGGGGIS